ncbi:MAG: cytochrome b N-terminal domain-containing protein [Pseudomonadales bacterium]|jgi:quinol-cytochrome oxidoreductase complex cytochrome b subunit/coenzyme F420-reducing hydrogenase delta subunit/Fe-S-cluster-containing hydrogenase component 2|nr:cytochrome b N-terminal domain-containing protein [Pseudomonadales bacterium]
MIRKLQHLMLGVLERTEAAFDSVFGTHWNPWYQLGALSFHMFWIVVVSGIYLYVFFDTSIVGAYASVQALTEEQWYLGGVMRSLHRYASDAMVVTVTLHLLREFAKGRFRGAQTFSWVSGVPLLWLLFASGIGGYWLVWDQFAQYVAQTTTEWLERLPAISDSLARTFLSDATLSDRLFSLLVFMHIAIPLFLLVGMFIHVNRLKLARTQPANGLAIGVVMMLVVLSLVKPARSMAPADLKTAVASVDLDWVYMNFYPLLDRMDPLYVWIMLAGITALLVMMPWLSPQKTPAPLAAVVDPNNCNGCSWCFQDCPYEAITMIPHEFKKGQRQALVDPDRCTACGICAGSCPSATPFRHVEELVSGIEIPGYPIDRLREEAVAKLATLNGDARVMVFGCDHALPIAQIETAGVAALSLPCIGMLPPSFVDYIARQDNVDGVLVSGCCTGDCFYRKGSNWTEERFASQRMPHLRTSVGHEKVKVCWASVSQGAMLAAELADFRARLAHEPIAGGTPADPAEATHEHH